MEIRLVESILPFVFSGNVDNRFDIYGNNFKTSHLMGDCVGGLLPIMVDSYRSLFSFHQVKNKASICDCSKK